MDFSDDHLNQSKPRTPAVLAATGEGRIRRRNRMITSCLGCRRRKLKCDKLVSWKFVFAILGHAIEGGSIHEPIPQGSRGPAIFWRVRWTRSRSGGGPA